MLYKSPLIQAMHMRIMADKTAKDTLKESLKGCMLIDSDVSLVDAKSLHYFILDYYKLPKNIFADVNLVDFVALGKAIISQ